MEAVVADDPRYLEQSLAELGEEGVSGPEGQSLLDEACTRGHTGCVRILLNAGCSPDATSRKDGMIPVHLAARNGHTE